MSSIVQMAGTRQGGVALLIFVIVLALAAGYSLAGSYDTPNEFSSGGVEERERDRTTTAEVDGDVAPDVDVVVDLRAREELGDETAGSLLVVLHVEADERDIISG